MADLAFVHSAPARGGAVASLPPLSCWLPLSLPVQQVKNMPALLALTARAVSLCTIAFLNVCAQASSTSGRTPAQLRSVLPRSPFRCLGLAGRPIVGIDSVHVEHAVFPYFPFFSCAHSFWQLVLACIHDGILHMLSLPCIRLSCPAVTLSHVRSVWTPPICRRHLQSHWHGPV